ncbi:MAG: hypothetical protein V4550_06080 [Gemmatimonadota bacterium]
MIAPRGPLAVRTLLILALAGCDTPPVAWSAVRSLPASSGIVRLTGNGDIVADSLVAINVETHLPAPACPGSIRYARDGASLVAVWWSPRPDSSASLVFSRKRYGAEWGVVVPVDTTDRGVTGCRRSPPAVTADSATRYIHVSYGLVGVEGPGIFFSHSMDAGALFHSPVSIVYGEHIGATSVASDGDRVAVAFEDPNGGAARIGLALSRTMGHIFEDRILPVSADNGSATQPLVAIRGRTIAVAWQERAGSAGIAAFRVRTGSLH